MRKEVIGNCTLYCGDCMDIIKNIEFNNIVTDIPYGIEELVGRYGRDGSTIKNDIDLSAFRNLYNYVNKNLDNMWFFTFYSCRNSPLFFDIIDMENWYGEIIWNKKAGGMGQGIRYQHENIAVMRFGSPEKLDNTWSVLTDYRCGKVHPHEKPVPTMQKILNIIPDGITLDPFMGSGTTGVACQKMGKNFIGIELDPEYFDIACKRIEEASRQKDLFL